MNHLETALRTLADDPFQEPAPSNLADRALTRAQTRRSRRRGVISMVGAATVAAVVAVGVTTAADQRQQPAPNPAATTTTTTPAFAKPRMNVLLIGSDAAPNRIGVRPDTIMLASIDTRTGATTLLSLPRSLQRVPFPAGSPGAKAWPEGYYCPGSECMLNAVWTWAEESTEYRKDPTPGQTATTQVVEAISGLSVDETVVLTMQGLADLVDAVGGVDVTVRERLPIGGNSTTKVAKGWIEKGRQHMDGTTALWFARSRWSTDDDDRIGRQQCLITALTQQLDARTLLTAYPKIARKLRSNLSTSIKVKDLTNWVELAIRMRDAPIVRISEQVPGGTADPDYAEIRRRVSAAIRATEALSTTSPPAAATSADTSTTTPQATKASSTGSQWLRSDAC